MPAASRFFGSPVPYAVWAGIVVLGLAVTWRIDPYLFAFATLLAGVGTIVAGVAGVIAQIRLEISIKSRQILAASITAAAIAVVVALALLSRVRWA
jgi:anaerobic C4-dicarboxylate transporter